MRGVLIYKLQLYYKDEYIRLFQGDCLETMDKIIEKGIKFPLILTDVPYGTTACSWDSVIPLEEMWSRVEKLTDDKGGVIALFASQPFTTQLIHSRLNLFKYCWYWVKKKPNGFQHAKNRPMMKVEEVCIFSKSSMGHISQLGDKRMNYNPQGIIPNGKRVISGKEHGRMMGARPNQIGNEYESYTNFPHNVLQYDNIFGKKALHPTQKPVDLLEYLINTYTNENELILDFTCGSGSTLVAAKNLKRKCIGIELEEKYCEIAKNRLIA